MMGTIQKFIRMYIGEKENHSILLLRILLVAMIGTVVFLIFYPRGLPQSHARPTKVSVNNKEVSTGEPFRFATTHLCAAVMEGTVSPIDGRSVELTFLKKQQGDKRFIHLTPPEVHKITDGACIPAHAACEDMAFEYCFSLDTARNSVVIQYEVSEKSI